MSESLGEVEPILEEMGREKSLSVQESLSEISESDVAKFPALFGVRQIIKSDPQEARQQLVEAVGYFFLSRMLRSKEAPSGCPPRFYQSVALSVLACFVEDEDIMTDASVLFNIPELIFIIENSDSEEYEDDVMLVNDAYKVISAIVATRVGREAFIASRGMSVLTSLNVRQGFQDEEALELLLDLLTYERDTCWCYYSGYQDLFFLLRKISENYEKLAMCEDIDLSDIVETIMLTIPSSSANPLGPESDPGANLPPSAASGSVSSEQHIGSVIEISPHQNDCDKLYLSFFFFDRLESYVNTAREDTDTILSQCHASLADSGGMSDQGCGYIYRMFHCYPSDSLIEKSRGTLDTIPEINC